MKDLKEDIDVTFFLSLFLKRLFLMVCTEGALGGQE